MTLILFVFFGGALTILSPCILPVLPFVFARAEQPFLRNGLPMLIGMALTFAAVATLAAVGGAWGVHLNQYGRIAALVALSLLALTLLSEKLADRLAQPFVELGNRLSQSSQVSDGSRATTGVLRSGLLGVATGLLWAPCAGPILGLVLTGAAISGPTTHTTFLLLAYALGAASSLALALLAGRRLFTLMKKSLGAGVWIRRGLGVAVLGAVAVIASGMDTGALTELSLTHTDRIEQALLNKIRSSTGSAANGQNVADVKAVSGPLPQDGPFPSLDGAAGWINSQPLTPAQLRGKVVLVDFWTYSCINCLRSLPFVKTWYDKYKDYGLVVIGVHSPEFAFEKDPSNVRHAVGELGVTYPVALDNDYSIWKAFQNKYWPAHYFIDAQGQIRGHHYGEGDYDGSEQIIRQLLSDAGAKNLPPAGMDAAAVVGVQASADSAHERSPETYVGFARALNFSSPSGFVHDQPANYTAPATLALNQWALQGNWLVSPEHATLQKGGGAVGFHFLARDLHLVLGPGKDGHPIRYRVLLDGKAPGADHGADTDANGEGTVRDQRLYQLIRQSNDVQEHDFSIQFLDDGVTAYAFTFG
jgi:cytochrome c biogenesis protein CcdA/thiol-disulfide isomerase/thioredoxin